MTDTQLPPPEMATPGALAQLRAKSGWLVVLGFALIILGAMALGSALVATLASTVVFGWYLIVSGVVAVITAFACSRWGGFLVDLLLGILYVVAGFMMVAHPGGAALALTLVIATYLAIGGLFRILAALTMHLPHRGWVVLNGVISLLLGIGIWRQWPLSGLWVIGVFVGIDLVLHGWTSFMLGLAARRATAAAPAVAGS